MSTPPLSSSPPLSPLSPTISFSSSFSSPSSILLGTPDAPGNASYRPSPRGLRNSFPLCKGYDSNSRPVIPVDPASLPHPSRRMPGGVHAVPPFPNPSRSPRGSFNSQCYSTWLIFKKGYFPRLAMCSCFQPPRVAQHRHAGSRLRTCQQLLALVVCHLDCRDIHVTKNNTGLRSPVNNVPRLSPTRSPIETCSQGYFFIFLHRLTTNPYAVPKSPSATAGLNSPPAQPSSGELKLVTLTPFVV